MTRAGPFHAREVSAFAGRIAPPAPFGEVIAAATARGRLIVQPRMGMGDPVDMRAGLLAVKAANASTVGTITVDSYTRCNDDEAVRRAIARDAQLNGYPIVAHSSDVTSAIVKELRDASFAIQVRHGSADPQRIFEAVVAAGLDATEGGPISYCLPYSRLPLADSVKNWAVCCQTFGRLRDKGYEPHLETLAAVCSASYARLVCWWLLACLRRCFFPSRGCAACR